MATFKTCVRKQRKDGLWPVYVRVTHLQKIAYIKTDKLVSNAGLGRGNEVEDPFVLKFTTGMITRFVDRMNRVDSSAWSVHDVVDYLMTGEQDVCFSDYARAHYAKMINAGQVRNAKNYELALQHLERFAGTTRVMFGQLTSTFVNKWIDSMAQTRRAKEMYPICMRQVFKAACRELNDYDNGLLKIKTNPWPKVDIPRADRPEKLAITPGECKQFFYAPIPESKMKSPLPELGRDVAMMVLCLGGINTIDLFELKKVDYYDGILHYNRAKTKGSRRDGAYMEMRVPDMLRPVFDKYLDHGDSERLFVWHERYSSSDSFGANVNIGIRKLCESMGMKKEDRYCVYTFRHTWGTVAQNDCGASLSEVAFGMNHSSGHTVTRGYVKLDFSPAWELNEKVVERIFLTEEKEMQQPITAAEEEESFERFSKKYLMRGTLMFKGRVLGQVEDIGFGNVEEIIAVLVKMVPEEVPVRSVVQIKIENLDKKQVAWYERMKGKGF